MIFVKVLGVLIVSTFVCAEVEEIYTWNYVDYKSLPKPRDYYITPDEPYYVPENTGIQGIGYHASTGLFIVAVARVKKGVPATVNAFCADKYRKGTYTPQVWGFPNYEINELEPEYFYNSKKRSARSTAEDEIKKDVEKETTQSEIKKEALEVKNEDQIKTEIVKEEKIVENTEKNSDGLSELEDSGKKGGVYANKHTSGYYTHTSSDYYKPHKAKPQDKPQKGHTSHSKPNYHHTSSSEYYKPIKNKPHYAHAVSKPQKNKYGSLSQIHSVHSHSSHHQESHYVPLPYKEPKPTSPPTKTPDDNYPPTPEEHMISVYHPVIDNVCDRVWLLDSGSLDYSTDPVVIYSTSIWIVDIPKDQKCGVGPYRIRKRYAIPLSVVSVAKGITNLALDYKKGGTCDDVFAYFANTDSSKINVYDYKKDKSWSFHDHYSFFPVLKTSTFELAGEEVTSETGAFSITLGWRNAKGYRTAYYISPTSTVQFGVSTEVLKQEDLAPDNYNPEDFRPIGNRGCDTHAVMHIFDSKNGVIFYGDRNSHCIRCWNVRKPLTPDNVDAIYCNENIHYSHDISIDEYGNLWLTSNDFPLFDQEGNTLDIEEINIRLYRVHVDDAIKGTVCANDDDEYRGIGVYDYPKAVVDFFASHANVTEESN
ncbi:hypothetical protein DMENIID0001_027320 [Sergentomyia squamirostris]